jgi:hypothetical protein
MSAPLDVRIVANLSHPDTLAIGLTAASTIIGALIGATIAYLVARQTAKENRQAATAARRQAEEAATLRAEVKLMQLANAIAGYHHYAERGIEQAKIAMGDPEIETWLVMRSFAGKATEINIDADDLIAFTRAREFDFVTRILYLVSIYTSMIYGVESYGKRRDELLNMITPDQMEGLIGHITTSKDEFRHLAPYIATVSDLAEQARVQMKEVYDLCLQVLDEFGPIVRRYFDDPKFPIPGRAPGDGSTAAAAASGT